MAQSETIGNLQQVIDWIHEGRDRAITSLSEYTKKTLIMSRAYIEDSLVREDGTTAIMKFANQILGGLVLSATSMNNLVSGGRTVREMATMVSTEDFHCLLDEIVAKFGDKNVTVTAGLEGKELEDLKERAEEIKNGDVRSDKGGNTKEVKEIDLKSGLFAGRLVEVKINDGNGHDVLLYFYVQIMPYSTPTSVLEQFIMTNYKPDMMARFAKFKAGEIKFWKDLVFEVDLINKRKKALKADKDGILREIENRKQNQVAKSLSSKSFLFSKNHNSASSIIVVSRRTLDRIMKDEGLDYRRYDVRQKIMEATMSLMLIVYDPNYNTVDLYLHGISNAGNYSIDQIKESTKGKDKDAVDLKTLMTILSAGQVPRI